MNRLQASARRVMVSMIQFASEQRSQEYTTRNGGRFVRVKISIAKGDSEVSVAEWFTNEGRIEFSKAQQLIEEMLMAKRVREPGTYGGVKIDSVSFDESGRMKCNLDYSGAVRIGGGNFDPAELESHVGNQEVTK